MPHEIDYRRFSSTLKRPRADWCLPPQPEDDLELQKPVLQMLIALLLLFCRSELQTQLGLY